MSAVPAELPATAELPLNSATLGCVAVMRLHETSAEAVWEQITPTTRGTWLDLSAEPQGWRNNAWRSLTPATRKRLRTGMGRILALLAAIGADFVG